MVSLNKDGETFCPLLQPRLENSRAPRMDAADPRWTGECLLTGEAPPQWLLSQLLKPCKGREGRKTKKRDFGKACLLCARCQSGKRCCRSPVPSVRAPGRQLPRRCLRPRSESYGRTCGRGGAWPASVLRMRGERTQPSVREGGGPRARLRTWRRA